jgi:hypothetical protein
MVSNRFLRGNAAKREETLRESEMRSFGLPILKSEDFVPLPAHAYTYTHTRTYTRRRASSTDSSPYGRLVGNDSRCTFISVFTLKRAQTLTSINKMEVLDARDFLVQNRYP